MSAKVIRLSDKAQRKMQEKQRALQTVPRRAYDYFKTETPIDTGNAKNRTVFRGRNTIFANYRYATKLNRGSSKQAPDGMTTPTIAYIKKLVQRIMTIGS